MVLGTLELEADTYLSLWQMFTFQQDQGHQHAARATIGWLGSEHIHALPIVQSETRAKSNWKSVTWKLVLFFSTWQNLGFFLNKVHICMCKVSRHTNQTHSYNCSNAWFWMHLLHLSSSTSKFSVFIFWKKKKKIPLKYIDIGGANLTKSDLCFLFALYWEQIGPNMYWSCIGTDAWWSFYL